MGRCDNSQRKSSKEIQNRAFRRFGSEEMQKFLSLFKKCCIATGRIICLEQLKDSHYDGDMYNKHFTKSGKVIINAEGDFQMLKIHHHRGRCGTSKPQNQGS
ncbi:hypothetical protein K7X08_023079 [Anisodus acutangulus]|uniref:Uncharacterized protein n=1 Tax=Anisodus acutangulus TaxID=402998 RepID=A0A9Q1MCH0_9SOLA|nr:hypothetical protein K7X08_023079 [Anisodus acutangulus]